MTITVFPNYKPTGITISDSFNHPDFPYDGVSVDKGSNLNIIKLTKGLLSNQNNDYSITKYLPFHYVIEFYKSEYIIHNTRPIHVQYPNLKENNISKNHLNVCIIGNSNVDVYTNELYFKIYKLIILPMQRIHKLSFKGNKSTLKYTTGLNFVPDFLEHFI